MVANSANDSDCRRMGGDADWHEVHKGIVLDVRRKRSRYSLQARITVQPHINLQLSDKSRRHLEAFAPLRLELVSSLPVGELTLAQSFKQRIAEFIELGARPERLRLRGSRGQWVAPTCLASAALRLADSFGELRAALERAAATLPLGWCPGLRSHAARTAW